ncbi:hypothetical protein MXB_3933 [Myxobolus squamalis]|nr:hypothetical protein MXB_3933 [Myxobolus squamalis]
MNDSNALVSDHRIIDIQYQTMKEIIGKKFNLGKLPKYKKEELNIDPPPYVE